MMAMVGGLRFMAAGRFDTRAALGLTLGGIPGVLAAGLLVWSLPLHILKWVVVVVVLVLWYFLGIAPRLQRVADLPRPIIGSWLSVSFSPRWLPLSSCSSLCRTTRSAPARADT